MIFGLEAICRRLLTLGIDITLLGVEFRDGRVASQDVG